MTPPPRRRRAAGTPAPTARKLGDVRRTQLVTTYGVGSLVAIDNESFIVAGLDSWDISTAPEIFERRLGQILGVRSFRLPPAPDPDRGTDGVRARRFPEFYSCPTCHALQPYSKFNSEPGSARCQDCSEELVPSRFVLACDNGHIEDFPFWKWVHRGVERAGLCGGKLTLHSDGSTASLRSVVVRCSCGVPEVSMEGAFRAKSLKDLGIRCEGRRPWLSGSDRGPCDQPPRAMQRGSSSTWHPIMNSALSIPPWGEGVPALVEKHKLFGASDDTIRWFFSQRPGLLSSVDATVEDVIDVVHAAAEEDSRNSESEVPVAKSHSRLRHQEYEHLVKGKPEKHSAALQSFVCEPPLGSQRQLRELGLEGSMLVKRLREVRALSSFVRGELPSSTDREERYAKLSLRNVDWLPAIEVMGEGVFLRLDEARLSNWEANSLVAEQGEKIRRNHLALLRERAGKNTAATAIESPVTPRLILLHTLAHALITEWSLDGGYPASALRERLYSDDTMAGVLIYTATSDSAGSLGGVVAQGEPERLSKTLRSALDRTAWCSHDPLCMEVAASGANGLNLAACHACVLLPETSCETMNGFLDRGLLIGNPSDGIPGFFAS
ncbi:DrmB family protein [Nocardia sp. NPDC055321]